ncbi:cysteine protease [Penicillium freii]|nr:cysteine protease [Penicillium freii]
MGPDDRMLLCMDAHSDRDKIWKSYHDPQGVQAVIESQFLSADTRAVLKQTPKVLPRWDPMGVLA